MINGLQSVWHNPYDENSIYDISNLAAQLNLSMPIATVLYNRGFKTKKDTLLFLFPAYDAQFYDTKIMHNAELAIIRILKAVDNKEKILICGDYDVDGITSTSLLLYALLELKADVNFFLPHRVRDGYGLSAKMIARAKQSGYSLVITVDNGTCAFEALLKAKELNIDVIVTDHHQPKEFPDGVLYLVNPHQRECVYPFKELAGVGVVFKLVTLLYQIIKKEIPDKIYELFLLGTIADLVPLVDENRYWIKFCLEKMKKNNSQSMALLKKNAKIVDDKFLTSQDIAFSLAPQINALGRLDDPRNGVLFFVQNDQALIETIGQQLSFLNAERKKREKDAIDKVLIDIKHDSVHPHEVGCIIKASREFPVGIVGLIAARLNQQYYVPTCILTESDNGILKGSCRTIPKCNLFELLSSLDPSLLLTFGGHKAAAGVSLKKENLPAFAQAFSKAVLINCSREDFQQKITIDSYLDLEDITHKLWKDLSLLEPFGAENAVPIFCITDVIVLEVKIIKEVHVKLTLMSLEKKIPIIFFNRMDIINSVKINQKVSVLAKITQNTWNEKSNLELHGVDLAIL
jgi:single-stranded-DNA-specific exonuclease